MRKRERDELIEKGKRELVVFYWSVKHDPSFSIQLCPFSDNMDLYYDLREVFSSDDGCITCLNLLGIDVELAKSKNPGSISYCPCLMFGVEKSLRLLEYFVADMAYSDGR